MKRNLLAIAIPALLVAGAANAAEVVNKDGTQLDVYGRVNASNYLIKDSSGTSSARVGLHGQSKISDGVSAYGRFEWETKEFLGTVYVDESGASATNPIDNRYAFAGLHFGDIGSLDYGKNDGVLNAIRAYSDVLPEFGGPAASYVVLGDLTANVLTYKNSNLFGLVDGLSFAVQYADKDNDKIGTEPGNSNSLIADSKKQAFGFNVKYDVLDTGLSVGAGMAQTTKGSDKAATSYIVGANYDANNVYLGALYLNSQNLSTEAAKIQKINGYEVVAKYAIDFEVGTLTPSVGYIHHQGEKESAKGSLENYVEVGLQYDFNENVTALVDYKLNQIKGQDDQVALGLIYNF